MGSAVRKLSIAILAMLLLVLSIISPTVSVYAEENHDIRLVDNASLLSEEEYDKILEKLDEISNRQELEVVIVTEESIGDATPQDYADDYYDYHNYGYNNSNDGILLLVSMSNRKWHMSTCGYGIEVFTDAGLDYMEDVFVGYLSDGKYYEAFDKFASLCDEFTTQANEGKPYDVGNMPRKPFNPAVPFKYSCIIAIIAAVITTVVLRMQLKSVKPKKEAQDYVVKNSMRILDRRDEFVTAHVDKRRKAESSDDGGSSTHTSSSGTSHGGSGGSF